MHDIQPGYIFEDGYGRPVHIVSRNPWDKELLLGVYLEGSRHKLRIYLPDGRAYAFTEPKANLIKLIGESPCLCR